MKRPCRSRLHQLEEMDDRLRNAIWNFLLERFFVKENVYGVYELVRSVWTEVVGGRSDELPGNDDALLALVSPSPVVEFFRKWYLKASWNEVYDVLEHLLRKHQVKKNTSDANAMLSQEGSAYRFIGNVIAPITAEELAAIEDVAQLSDPFHGASQHITQAVTLLSDRSMPDFRKQHVQLDE